MQSVWPYARACGRCRYPKGQNINIEYSNKPPQTWIRTDENLTILYFQSLVLDDIDVKKSRKTQGIRECPDKQWEAMLPTLSAPHLSVTVITSIRDALCPQDLPAIVQIILNTRDLFGAK